MIKGYSVHTIAYMTGLSTVSISNKFKSYKQEIYIEEVKKASSNISNDYTWESLSLEEKLAYINYEEKHKAHYD